MFQIGNILSIDRNKLENACDQLKIEPLDSEEYLFLQQYHKIISKVSMALKSLEGDKHTFGLYLPTLFGLKKVLEKYSDLETTDTFECLELASALKTGFEKRFSQLMDMNDVEGKSAPLYLAMVSNPQYKLNYMGMRSISQSVLQHLKEMLVTACVHLESDQSEPNNNNYSLEMDRHGINQTFTRS